MSSSDWRGAAVGAISSVLVFASHATGYSETSLLEDVLGLRLGTGVEIALTVAGIVLFVGFLAYRRIPSDPDDREWVPEE